MIRLALSFSLGIKGAAVGMLTAVAADLSPDRTIALSIFSALLAIVVANVAIQYVQEAAQRSQRSRDRRQGIRGNHARSRSVDTNPAPTFQQRWTAFQRQISSTDSGISDGDSFQSRMPLWTAQGLNKTRVPAKSATLIRRFLLRIQAILRS
jgi:hypothetical protein